MPATLCPPSLALTLSLASLMLVVGFLVGRTYPRESSTPPQPRTGTSTSPSQRVRQSGSHGRTESDPACKIDRNGSSSDLCDGLVLPDTSAMKESTLSWGLPSASCKPSRHMLEEYPRLHARWRREDRILVYCSDTAWGNFVLGLPAAVLAAVLMERALILDCDALDRSHVAAGHLGVYFRGPHFDWSRDRRHYSSAHRHTPRIRLMKYPPTGHQTGSDAGVISADGLLLANSTLSTDSVVEFSTVPTSRSSGFLLRLLSHPQNMATALRKLGPLVRHKMLEGCLLRYVLSPTRQLHRFIRQETGVDHASLRYPPGASLLPMATLHVRMGDRYLAGVGDEFILRPNSGYTRADVRAGAFRSNPVQVVQCLARATSFAGKYCRQAFVVSDSAIVPSCARQVVTKAATSRGIAVMSNPAETFLPQNVTHTKYLVDWWLLAQSSVIVRMSEYSSFTKSATLMRDASSGAGGARGHTITLGKGFADKPGWIQTCTLP